MTETTQKTVAEVVAELPKQGVVRLYNTHPSKPFVHPYDSRWLIFNPANGLAFHKTREFIPGQGKSGRKKLAKYSVAPVPGKRGKNWLEVPVEEARKILQGNPSAMTNDMGQEDIFHHGGFVKTLDMVEEDISGEHAEKLAAVEDMKKQIADLERQIAEKQTINARILSVAGSPNESFPPPPPSAAGEASSAKTKGGKPQ